MSPTARILIVEDEMIVAQDVERRLRRRAYATAHVRTGEDALGAVQTLQPDLVLMDIGLPGRLDGIETACRIRKESAVPIVYVTASLDAPTRRRMAECPFDGCVAKPFTGEHLEATIAQVLKLRFDDRAPNC